MRPKAIDGQDKAGRFHIEQQCRCGLFGSVEAQSHFPNGRYRAPYVEREGIGNELVGRARFEIDRSQQIGRKVFQILGDDGCGFRFHGGGEHMRIFGIGHGMADRKEMIEIGNFRFGEGAAHSRDLFGGNARRRFGRSASDDKNARDRAFGFGQYARGPADSEKLGFGQSQQQIARQDLRQTTGIDEGRITIGEHGLQAIGILGGEIGQGPAALPVAISLIFEKVFRPDSPMPTDPLMRDRALIQ